MRPVRGRRGAVALLATAALVLLAALALVVFAVVVRRPDQEPSCVTRAAARCTALPIESSGIGMGWCVSGLNIGYVLLQAQNWPSERPPLSQDGQCGAYICWLI